MNIPHSTRIQALCLACWGLSLAPPVVHAQSRMGAAEAAQLYTAAGFPVVGNRPANRCGTPARPRVTFVDINADRQPEALFIDTDTACYAPSGRYFAVLVKDGDNWRSVSSGTGSIQALASRTSGWFDMRVSDAGCARQLHYSGHDYEPVTDCAGHALASAVPTTGAARETQQPVQAAAAAQTPAASRGGQAAAQTGAAAAPVKLSTADEAAAFKAAGLKKRGGKWQSDCGDPGTASYEPGHIEQVADVNGDGWPEAVITEGSTYCYGGTERAFWIVSKSANGSWKLIASDTGMVEFLKTKGVGDWPDISVGGPGFCFPVQRWNGKEYKLQRWEYEGKRCKPPR